MKKSVKCAVAAALLLLLCAVGIYGIFFAPRKIGCAVDDSFSWKAYSYTPVTSKTIYNYAFPSEEITLSAENRETIVQLLADSSGQMDTVRHEYQDSVRRCSANRQRGSRLYALSVQE